MQIDLIFKIAAVGILVAVLNTLLKKSDRDEQGMMVVIAGLVIVLVIVLREVSALFDTVRDLFGLY
jgi:stage III sporulation protein AC